MTTLFNSQQPLKCSIRNKNICIAISPLCMIMGGLTSERSLYNMKNIWELDHYIPKSMLFSYLIEKGFVALNKESRRKYKVVRPFSDKQKNLIISYFYSSDNLNVIILILFFIFFYFHFFIFFYFHYFYFILILFLIHFFFSYFIFILLFLFH